MKTGRALTLLLLAGVAAAAAIPCMMRFASGAPAPQSAVAAAEKAYSDGNYAAALKVYNELLEKASNDPAVLYDLGTVYAKQGERGRATWRYLQALKLDPRDASLVHNLRIVAPDFEQDLGVTPIPFLNQLFWRLTGDEWTALAAAATLAAMLLFALDQWIAPARSIRNAVRKLGILAFVAGALCWPPAALRYVQEHQEWRGVVVAEGAAAHTEPTEKSFENFSLPSGKIVRVLDKSNPGWLKIGFAGDRVGFVQREKVEFL